MPEHLFHAEELFCRSVRFGIRSDRSEPVGPGFGFRHFADCSGRRRSLRITAGRCFPRPNDCRPNRNEFRKPHMPADRRRKCRSRCTNSRPGCDFPPIERFFGNSVLFHLRLSRSPSGKNKGDEFFPCRRSPIRSRCRMRTNHPEPNGLPYRAVTDPTFFGTIRRMDKPSQYHDTGLFRQRMNPHAFSDRSGPLQAPRPEKCR